jgi:hypothetical protein
MGITVCGVMLLIVGITTVMAGISLDLADFSRIRLLLDKVGYYSIYPPFISSMGSIISLWAASILVASICLLKGMRIGRIIVMAILLIQIGVIGSYLIDQENPEDLTKLVLLLTLMIAMLLYLYRSHVKEYFNRRIVVKI